MLPSAVLTHLKAGVSTALRPEPVRIGWCVQPAAVTPRKHDRASLTTVQAASRLRLAKISISVRRKPRTRRSLRRTGRPSAVVDGGDDRCLAGRAAPPLAAGALAAEIGVIHLDAADEALGGVALHHHLLELMLGRPCRGLGDAEAPAELQAGDALLALGQMIEGAKPAAQRELGRREDGAGSERRLPPARGALIKRAGLDQAMLSAAAARTDEAVGPPPFGQRRPALLLAAVLTVESRLAEPLLGLNLVPSHRLSPGPVSIVLLLYTHRLG